MAVLKQWLEQCALEVEEGANKPRNTGGSPKMKKARTQIPASEPEDRISPANS